MYSLLIILLLCITTLFTATIAVPLKDDENIIKKPDIEDFIDRLLTSEKFEQLADKIAERAADKIITLQQDTSRFGDKKPDIRARNDEAQAPKHPSSHKTKHVKKEKDDSYKDDSEKEAKEKKINKNDKKRSNKPKIVDDELKKDLAEKTKIDTIAAIHKISEFPAEQLSLNYKHFTAQESTSTKSPKKKLIHKKEKGDNSKKSHRKHKSEEGDYESFLRAQLTDDSKSQEEPKDNNTKDSDKKKESSEIKAESKNRHNKNKKNDLHNNEKSESESSSSHESSASDENESLAMRQKNEENIKKIAKKVDNSIEKNESEGNEVDITTPASLRAGPTVPFGFADTDKSSEESGSDDNKVSNLADSAKLDQKLKVKIKNVEEKQEKLSEKKKNDKDNKIIETEKTDTLIDTKHKIREKNGKLYAFAISPDYEEYHEKLSSILKSVQNNQTKRSLVNKDLLDLVE